jgi:hypothetical protein
LAKPYEDVIDVAYFPKDKEVGDPVADATVWADRLRAQAIETTVIATLVPGPFIESGLPAAIDFGRPGAAVRARAEAVEAAFQYLAAADGALRLARPSEDEVPLLQGERLLYRQDQRPGGVWEWWRGLRRGERWFAPLALLLVVLAMPEAAFGLLVIAPLVAIKYLRTRREIGRLTQPGVRREKARYRRIKVDSAPRFFVADPRFVVTNKRVLIYRGPCVRVVELSATTKLLTGLSGDGGYLLGVWGTDWAGRTLDVNAGTFQTLEDHPEFLALLIASASELDDGHAKDEVENVLDRLSMGDA